MKFLILILSLTSSCLCAPFTWQQGDIIVQEGKSNQAAMIKHASNSPWTHVGVVLKDADGSTRVLEAVQPVRLVSTKAFLRRTKNYKVLRMKEPIVVTKEVKQRAQQFLRKNLNKNYDVKFMWGDDKMYCSELVWKCYHQVLGIELCKTRTFESYNLKHPEVVKVINKRFGSVKSIPKDHKIVAPSDIADSTLLQDVTPKL